VPGQLRQALPPGVGASQMRLRPLGRAPRWRAARPSADVSLQRDERAFR